MKKQTHAALAGSERVILPGARAIAATDPHQQIELLLKLRRKAPLPTIGTRPAKTMTREELGANYGASEEDIALVGSTFAKYGLRVVRSVAETRSVYLAGLVGQIEAAFQVKLFDYAHGTDPYRGRVGPIYLPKELIAVVKGVFGLDDRRVARRKPSLSVPVVRDLAAIPPSWYLPRDLAGHYNFPDGDGAGQTVGLLEFGGGVFPADLQQFCQLAGVTPPTVTPVSADGTPTNAKDGAEGEVMLDIEVVAGVCPKATIAVYFAHFTEKGWITVLDAALQDSANNPRVLSASWGYAEHKDIWTTQAMTQVNETLQEAAHLGVTVCVSAGDDGSSDSIADGHAYVDFPASSPYVLAVGGTTIPVKGGSQPDICWHEGSGLRATQGGSTGGGVSRLFPLPDWQKNIAVAPVNPGAIAGRSLPDLAANADWNASPYLMVVDGGAQPNGGTSAASPLIASLIALINAKIGPNKSVGLLAPLLYQPSGANGAPLGLETCTDVVSGDNITAKIGGYRAGKGYDAVSGWGTPDGKLLLQALAKIL